MHQLNKNGVLCFQSRADADHVIVHTALHRAALLDRTIILVGNDIDLLVIVQAVRGFSVHFWKKLQFFAQMISSMYSFDPDIAQSILTRLTPN